MGYAWPEAKNATAQSEPPTVDFPLVQDGLTEPLYVTHAGDGSGRLFIVEKAGLLKVLENDVLSTYVDLSAKVSVVGERGLLGLAFHPNFETNGQLYVSYTRVNDGALVVERLVANPPSTGLPGANGLVIITQGHSQFPTDNGGGIIFGPEGYLYIGWGDGGSACDQLNTGQNKNSLLGKMLRIDVDNADAGLNYGIPDDNPFADGGGKPEIWAIGLRNPWRWSFDRFTGDLWIADVGQSNWEEVNFMPNTIPEIAGGRNYGWNGWEGPAPATVSGCPVTNVVPAMTDPKFTPPVIFYSHVGGHCSVTGGYVYRGPGNAAIQGSYVYGDFCTGMIWTAQGVAVPVPLADTMFSISSFGEDEEGSLYVVDLDGAVYGIVTA